MTFKELMDLFDDWNNIITINDKNLNRMYRGKTHKIIDEHKELSDIPVLGFGIDYEAKDLYVKLDIKK